MKSLWAMTLAATMAVCLAASAHAASLSIPDDTLVVALDENGQLGAGVASSEALNAAVVPVRVHAEITDFQHAKQSYLEVNLIPADIAVNSTWNQGVFVISWESWGLGVNLAIEGDGSHVVYPLDAPTEADPWVFDFTLTPSPGGGTATLDFHGFTFDTPQTPLAYTGDFTTAVLVVQLGSTSKDAAMTFRNVYATHLIVPGDANNDGVVSADDFAAVQTSFGSTGDADGLLPGDANDDGVVSADDFAAIQTNFGNVLGAAAATTPVPEPASLALLLAAGAMFVPRRRR